MDAVTVIQEVTTKLVEDCQEDGRGGGSRRGAPRRGRATTSTTPTPACCDTSSPRARRCPPRSCETTCCRCSSPATRPPPPCSPGARSSCSSPRTPSSCVCCAPSWTRCSGTSPFPTSTDMTKLPYLERCFHESMRLYPQPPVYTRRAVVEDVLPKNLGVIPAGQDLLVSIYNLHRAPANWGPDVAELRADAVRPVCRRAAQRAEHRVPVHALLRGSPAVPRGQVRRSGGHGHLGGALPQARHGARGRARRRDDVRGDDSHARRDARERDEERDASKGRRRRGGLGEPSTGEGHRRGVVRERASRRRAGAARTRRASARCRS